MNTTLSKVLIFAAGAAIGSVVTWKVLDKKLKDEYEQRLAEDTASIKESFSFLSSVNMLQRKYFSVQWRWC